MVGGATVEAFTTPDPVVGLYCDHGSFFDPHGSWDGADLESAICGNLAPATTGGLSPTLDVHYM